MQHLDEGIIHAWIDGELPPDEAARVEAHAASCASCGAMVAEARGLVAASSRIVSSLDSLPRAQRGVSNGVLPSFGARKAPRRWMTAKMTTAIAATLVIAAGTMMSVRGRDQAPISRAKSETEATTPLATPALLPPAVTPKVATRAPAAGRTIDHAAPPQPSRAAAMPAATIVADSQLRAAATAATPTGVLAARGGAAPQGKASAGFPRSMAVAGRSAGMLSEAVVTIPSYAGCYELNESTDVLPKRFALREDSARAGLYEVRYVDSTGAVDGRMVDAGWLDTGDRAVIRTARLGDILTIARTEKGVAAESPLGPRTVRVTTCR